MYTSHTVGPSGFGEGSVYYQRLDSSSLLGPPVLVSAAGTDNKLNDISGDYIVYSAFDAPGSFTGIVKLYQISTSQTDDLSQLTNVQVARIHGDNVAWVEGAPGATTVMLFGSLRSEGS